MIPGTESSGNSALAWCLHQVRLFFTALQFFTRLPVPRWVGFEPDWLHHASRYFPLVGIVVAAVTGGVHALAALLWPPLVAALLSTMAGIYLTGAFHEDGFADTCDGFGGGATPQRIMEIMKDSRIGAYGAIGISLLLALKCAALSDMPTPAALAALFIAHPLSRLAAASLILRLDYARTEGKAKPLAQHMSAAEFMIAAITACLPAMVLCLAGWMSWRGMAVSAIAAALATIWLAGFFQRRIGGFTGDCLGAVQQVTEVVLYLGMLACL
ncbi:MAG TPA: adenosylcobinamide-GDP ribazoletransferase [Burkholderiaceae bacterium]|nr:adenosylcobinamide-GDP ribazoletransferase [Burkholderiaceae bacterium]